MLKKLLVLLLALYAAMAFAAVDVNSADATQLDGVKGIGPAIAGKITAERKKAPFKDWDDLINRVSGIGDKTAVKLSENGLTVNGATFKGVAAKPAAAPAAKPAASAAMSADDKKAAKKKAKEEKAAAAAAAKASAPAAKK